jgi:hypothetical protein
MTTEDKLKDEIEEIRDNFITQLLKKCFWIYDNEKGDVRVIPFETIRDLFDAEVDDKLAQLKGYQQAKNDFIKIIEENGRWDKNKTFFEIPAGNYVLIMNELKGEKCQK